MSANGNGTCSGGPHLLGRCWPLSDLTGTSTLYCTEGLCRSVLAAWKAKNPTGYLGRQLTREDEEDAIMALVAKAWQRSQDYDISTTTGREHGTPLKAYLSYQLYNDLVDHFRSTDGRHTPKAHARAESLDAPATGGAEGQPRLEQLIGFSHSDLPDYGSADLAREVSRRGSRLARAYALLGEAATKQAA